MTLKNIKSYYNEPGRFYHNYEHVEDMLYGAHDLLFEEKIDESEMDILYQAIQFHDVIYECKQDALNEERSARLSREYLRKMNYKEWFASEVEDMILLSARHTEELPNITNLQKVFLDLDLKSFYNDFATVYVTNAKVRAEWIYAGFAPELVAEKNKEFLEKLIEKGFVYRSKHFAKYNERALENIKRLISL